MVRDGNCIRSLDLYLTLYLRMTHLNMSELSEICHASFALRIPR